MRKGGFGRVAGFTSFGSVFADALRPAATFAVGGSCVGKEGADAASKIAREKSAATLAASPSIAAVGLRGCTLRPTPREKAREPKCR